MFKHATKSYTRPLGTIRKIDFLRNWILIGLVFLGLIPIIILNPLSNCWNAMKFYPFLIGVVVYILLVILALLLSHYNLKGKIKLWKILVTGLLMIGLQFCSLKLLGNLGFTKPINTYQSEIDHQNTYHHFRVSLMADNEYRLERINQLGGCTSKGNYLIQDSVITFDDNIVEFSWSRLAKSYKYTSSGLAPISRIDTIKQMALKKIK